MATTGTSATHASDVNHSCWSCTPEKLDRACNIMMALSVIALTAVFIVGLLGYFQTIPMDLDTSYGIMVISGTPLATVAILSVVCFLMGPKYWQNHDKN